MIVFYGGNVGANKREGEIPERLNLPVLLTYWELVKPGATGKRDSRAVWRFKHHKRQRSRK